MGVCLGHKTLTKSTSQPWRVHCADKHVSGAWDGVWFCLRQEGERSVDRLDGHSGQALSSHHAHIKGLHHRHRIDKYLDTFLPVKQLGRRCHWPLPELLLAYSWSFADAEARRRRSPMTCWLMTCPRISCAASPFLWFSYEIILSVCLSAIHMSRFTVSFTGIIAFLENLTSKSVSQYVNFIGLL